MFYLTKENLLIETYSKLQTDEILNPSIININEQLCYLNRIDDQIYCKKVKILDEANYQETIIRVDISNSKEPKIDTDFEVDLERASHNFYCFQDKNGKNMAIGGINLWTDSDKNKKYTDGLYLFEFVDDKIVCLNNEKPIISKTIGNYDGFYGTNQDPTDIEKCRNGTIKFDSIGSILFNEKENMYYLYHRSNPIAGTRLIQFAKSADLINWSEFNLINLDIVRDYSGKNIYYSNFFKVPNSNIIIGLLPYVDYNERRKTTKISNGIGKIKNPNILRLNTPLMYVNKYIICYSYDYVNFYYVGNFLTQNSYDLENTFISTNYPKVFENNMYLYNSVLNKLLIETYKFGFNRFFYLTNDQDKESLIITKLIELEKNSIKVNLSVESNGYVEVELHDEKNKTIDNFTFEKFDKITNYDSIDHILSWNSFSLIPTNKVIMKIKLLKAKIYTINGKIME